MIGYTVVLLGLCQVHLAWGTGGIYGKAADSTWNYLWNTQLGNWSAKHPHCGGSVQSPINILSADTEYNPDLGSLKLVNYDQTEGVSFFMKNRNTDIEFTPKSDNGGDVPQAVELADKTTWRLFQMHVHWGSASFQGSEHLVDSQQYAAEMHIIHYNTKYANFGEAINKTDGLLVWGNFLKVDRNKGTPNKEFAKMVGRFGDALECCNTTKVTLNLFELLPTKKDEFFTYGGSLTTPPCYESVKWVLNRNPILVSNEQMEKFRELKDVAMGLPLVDHYRPTQALNGRKVERNFEELTCVNSASVTTSAVSITTFLSIVVYYFLC